MSSGKLLVRLLLLCVAGIVLWKGLEVLNGEDAIVNNQINIQWGSPSESEKEPAKVVVVKRTGLQVKEGKFLLNNAELTIRAGSVHYFRMMPDYWLYTLTALKNSGLNTVDTCVPWNVHEELRGKFNWRTMNDLRHFISIAKDLGLFVILRIGPYVNCDLDFGGMPAWLLSYKGMRIRSTLDLFLNAYDAYVSELARRIEDFQYSVGGNVIAFEVETDVAGFIEFKPKAEAYVSELIKILRKHSLIEPPFTSVLSKNTFAYESCSFALARDGNSADVDALAAWDAAEKNAQAIRSQYQDAPMFVTIYTGTRTNWGDKKRNGVTDADFRKLLEKAIEKQASFVITMFAGSTNFDFLAPGSMRPLKTAISSYDMDAVVSEYGSLRVKYDIVRELLVTKLKLLSKEEEDTLQPDLDTYRHHIKLYDSLSCSGYINYSRLVDYMVPEPVKLHELGVYAEGLSEFNGGSGSTQGFIVYRARIPASRVKDGRLLLKLTGKVNDRLLILVNYRLFNESNPFWAIEDERMDVEIDLTRASGFRKYQEIVLDLLVENSGRDSVLDSARWLAHARKGIQIGSFASVNDATLRDWLVYPLEFRQEFFHLIDRLRGEDVWDSHPRSGGGVYVGPALFKYSLRIERNVEPCDTFIEFPGYSHGIAFVNALGVGRYNELGPQRTLFVPGAVMRHDYWNKFYFFEMFASPGYIKLSDHANFRG